MRNYNYSFILILLLNIAFSSCISSKKIIYLQGEGFDYKSPTSINNTNESYRLQSNDIINIRVLNSDPNLSDIFNLQSSQGGSGGGFSNSLSIFLTSYIIDKEGKITVPLLGSIDAINLTTRELETKIQKMLEQTYLNKSTVIIRLPNFMISVLGEVKIPGRFPIYQERISLLDILALSGDLNEFANRKNLKLIRQKDDKLEVILIDLTNKDFLKSPYYFLKPGDIIYVEPMKTKARRSNLPVLGIVFSGLSTTVLILNLLLK